MRSCKTPESGVARTDSYYLSSISGIIEEFEEKVSEGSISRHSGWEDLIIVEKLENSISKLKNKRKIPKK